MQLSILILVFAVVVFGALIILAAVLRKSNSGLSPIEQGKHPQGYWMGLGLSFGFLFGYAISFIIGLVIDDMKSYIAIAPSIGAGFGLSIGYALEKRNKDNIRPLTEQEQKVQRIGIILGLGMLLVFGGIFTLIMVIRFRY